MASYMEVTRPAEDEVQHQRFKELAEMLTNAVSTLVCKAIEENRRGKEVSRRLIAAKDQLLIRTMQCGQSEI